MRYKQKLLSGLLLTMLMLCSASIVLGQGGDPMGKLLGKFIIYGDVSVTGAPEEKPLTFTIELVLRRGAVLERQTVGSKGRYQFINVENGDYEIVVEFENNVIWREQVKLTGMETRFRQDIALEWKSSAPGGAGSKPATVSPEDMYDRKGANKARFEKGEEAYDKKQYDQAVTLFTQIVTDDPKDFQAWSELGTTYVAQKNMTEAEKAYQHATEVRPTFFLALLNLGRLRMAQKNFEGAIAVLEQAVAVQPSSADANYRLGDSYLQIKKGSKAVGYLNEALKLDPVGKADAHLLLAALYNGAGMKDKAAAEYEGFLKAKPDYADRKKLEAYIAANKARAP
jgi:tetratricopeptide (TPR) repeat protein